MGSNEFLKEIAAYSDDDLELIIQTQKELYSAEEMQLLEAEYQKRWETKHEKIVSNLPKEIQCPKCDGPNAFENTVCVFCGFELAQIKEQYIKESTADIENGPVINETLSEGAQFEFRKLLEKYSQQFGTASEEVEAKLFAQAVELQLLKAPSTAKFCELEQMTVSQKANGVYEISGFVDAQNSYGAALRTDFTVSVFKDAEGWKDADKTVDASGVNPLGIILMVLSGILDIVSLFMISEYSAFKAVLAISSICFIIGLVLTLVKKK